METIILTSPPDRGPDVKIAQRSLKRNVFETDFLEAEADGVFDLETGRACKRAKYWLGYLSESIEPNFGPQLADFLEGERPLSDAMKDRRRARLAHRREDVRERALKIAKGHLGKEEKPAGSNSVVFSRWYMGVEKPDWTAARPGPAWCLIFVSKCYVDAIDPFLVDAGDFEGIFKQGVRFAFCPTVVQLAQHGEGGFDQTRNPEPGDLVFYQFDADSNADHVGIFEKWIKKGETFAAIEGNTSSSSDANGGRVERRTRSVSLVYRPRTGGRSFVRVGPLS